MIKKTTIAATTLLVLAGVLAIVLISKEEPTKNTTEAAAEGRPTRSQGSGTSTLSSSNNNNSRSGDRAPLRYPDLAIKYGESRTNLSKHVTSNVVGLLEDALIMAELVTSGETRGLGIGRFSSSRELGEMASKLNLDENQQAAANQLYADFQKREIERTKKSIEKLKNDPTELMQIMLANDALKRGEMSKEEYKEVHDTSKQDLSEVVNPMEYKKFDGGHPLKDEAFVSDFQAILSPDQASALQSSLNERARITAEKGEVDTKNISNIPPMELDQLDRAVTSGKRVTNGLRELMSGFSSFKEVIQPN